ncbi:MAG: hypothetical protein H6625_04335 [Bdellovibrionaceae bacterium]|nr:hypothetical protein [Pseudobdellovibrionaceae bacterium]
MSVNNVSYPILRLVLSTVICLGFAMSIDPKAKAELVLDKPDKLMVKASKNRQELRDVLLSLQQQLPEMRSVDVFESYFFLLKDLNELAIRFNLNEVYPEAIRSLGFKMSAFGVKWMDLSQMDQLSFAYYLKWMNADGLFNLLATSNYILQTIDLNEKIRLKVLAENVDFLINLNLEVIKQRVDLALGYRNLLTDLAIRNLQQNHISDSEKNFWFQRIYSSAGMGYYLDSIQLKVNNLNESSKEQFPQVYEDLLSAYVKLKSIVDAPTYSLNERISELIVEWTRKCLEFNIEIDLNQLENVLFYFSPRSMQWLSSMIISISENFLVSNSTTIKNIFIALWPRLIEMGLVTEAKNFEIFLGRSMAAFKVREFSLEGTYFLTDVEGKEWTLTLVSSGPIDLTVAVADSLWMSFKSFYYVRYNPKTEIYIASYSQYENEIGLPKSTIRFKIHKKSIEVIDKYARAGSQKMKGRLGEPLAPFNLFQKRTPFFSRSLKGNIKFKLGQEGRDVTMILQGNGQNITARIQDKVGPIFDFESGFITNNGVLILNTGPLQNTTWAQLRGTLKDKSLRAEIIVGGRGKVTEQFLLQDFAMRDFGKNMKSTK